MTRRSYSNFKWDVLLDGEKHLVDLEAIGWDGGLADFRATVHYQADKRRGTAQTRKVGPALLEVQAFGCKSLEELEAAAQQRYQEQLQAQRQRFAAAFAPQPQPAQQAPTFQEQPPTSDEDYEPLTPEEEEALLGPCTCGQAPTCLPTCARAGGTAA